MKLKVLLKRTSLIIVFTGLAFSLALLFSSIPDILTQSSSASLAENLLVFPKHEQASAGIPVRLKIPRINIDIALESVGLTSKGAVGVPKSPVNAAWFDLGPRPGDSGSAVITGHYGTWENGQEAVFNDLNKLSEGDVVYVEDDKGIIISFIVRESRSYDPKADVSIVFNLNDRKSHLNLITCEGIWNKVSKTYSQRLVVFTDREIK